MNKIIIKGRLTRDPELKTGSTGTEYAKFTVAVDRRGSKEKQTDFFDCTAFGKTAVAINTYMTKGREILVEGRMESSKSDKDGVKRTYWGISVDTFEFCGNKAEQQAAPAPAVDAQSGMEQVDIPTDDLPF